MTEILAVAVAFFLIATVAIFAKTPILNTPEASDWLASGRSRANLPLDQQSQAVTHPVMPIEADTSTTCSAGKLICFIAIKSLTFKARLFLGYLLCVQFLARCIQS